MAFKKGLRSPKASEDLDTTKPCPACTRPWLKPDEGILKAFTHLLIKTPDLSSDEDVLNAAFKIFENLSTRLLEAYNEQRLKTALWAPIEAAIEARKPEAVIALFVSDEAFAALQRLRSARKQEAEAETEIPDAPPDLPTSIS